MGNLQTGDAKQPKTGKSPGKIKGKIKLGKAKKSKDELHFTGVVPEESDVEEHAPERPVKKSPAPTVKHPEVLVTDSWRAVNRTSGDGAEAEISPPSAVSSSSDSNFTDPLTPVGFNAEHNECYQSEESILDVEVPNTVQDNFLHNLTLNR